MGGIDDQINEASFRQLKVLLEAQMNLRRAAEGDARASRKAMERIAEGVVPEEVNKLRERDPVGLAVMPPDQIADMVLAAIGRFKSQLDAVIGEAVDVETLLELRHRAAQADDLAEQVRQLEAQLSGHSPPDNVLPMSGEDPPGPSTPPWMDVTAQPAPEEPAVPFDAWPEWARQWQALADKNQTYQRNADIIAAVGDTGLARRQDVTAIVADWWGVSADSGGVARGFRRLRDEELIDLFNPDRSGRKGWQPSHLIKLTEKGRDIYRLLRGVAPVSSQTAELLKRHQSPEHATLNIEAAEALWQAGYRVNLFPDPVELDVGRYYPDLVAISPEGEHLYVECERATYKDPEARKQKWSRYYTATTGHFVIITPDAVSSEKIQEEILAWAGDRPLTLWVTDVERAGSAFGDFWDVLDN